MHNNKKIIVFSPNPESYWTTSVCELLIRKGITIEAVFVKKFTLKRFLGEFNRDGFRLVNKIFKKLILKKHAYSKNTSNVISYRNKKNITLKNVNNLRKNGVSVFYVNDLNSKFVESKLKLINPYLCVFTGGGLIRENILNNSGVGVINCHMGILPKYRGMDVVEWPILLNDFNNLGITVHFMDKGVDTGDIIKTYKVKPQANDSIKTLRERFEPHIIEKMTETIDEYIRGKLKRQKQNDFDGKQFFIMHDTLKLIAERKLSLFLKSKK